MIPMVTLLTRSALSCGKDLSTLFGLFLIPTCQPSFAIERWGRRWKRRKGQNWSWGGGYLGDSRICDRIMVMEKGVVVEEGPTQRVFTAPAHPYTSALIEAAPGRGFRFGEAA